MSIAVANTMARRHKRPFSRRILKEIGNNQQHFLYWHISLYIAFQDFISQIFLFHWSPDQWKRGRYTGVVLSIIFEELEISQSWIGILTRFLELDFSCWSVYNFFPTFFILKRNKALVKPFKRQSHKMVKHTQKIHLPTNCLSVFDHFVGSAVKGLTVFTKSFIIDFSHILWLREHCFCFLMLAVGYFCC